jgi:SAM-dependent methyltransferase
MAFAVQDRRLPRTPQHLLRACLKLSINVKARKNYRLFYDEVRNAAPRPKVLVVGGGIEGDGMSELLGHSDVVFVESDVYIGPRTNLLCDAQALPVANESVDGLICQAVLHCVPDPYLAVREMYRVLKPGGIIYIEVPFCQQLVEGSRDLTRFTHPGLRHLCRMYSEISSGASSGPATTLSCMYKHFLVSFAVGRRSRLALSAVAHLTAAWLKYLDFLLIDRPAALDAAFGCFFLGRRSTTS